MNALTVDVEDYFQVNAFAKDIPRDSWSGYPLRVEDNTRRILDLFDHYEVKATFFVLGWVAERLPALVREIVHRGHELASHGYGHELVYAIGPERFRQDVRLSKNILENISGQKIRGYRAPSYSITAKSLWALRILVEEGFAYDSSIFPIRHDVYGIPGGERFPHDIQTESGPIREFPISTLEVKLPGKKFSLPIAGGGYLRLLPAPVVGRAIRKINEGEKKPAVVYFHPWEIDPGQPRIASGWKSRFRHYLNLEKMEGKVEYLLERVKFGTMGEVLLKSPPAPLS